MTIHHATRKKAEAAGFVLSEDTELDIVEAHHAETNTRSYGPNAKSALSCGQLNLTLWHHYKGLIVIYTPHQKNWEVRHNNELIMVLSKEPELADITDIIADEGLTFEDDVHTGTVVKPKYKEEYKARGKETGGKGTDCADWLAQFLRDKFEISKPRAKTAEDGSIIKELKPLKVFDFDAFADFLVLNSVPLEGKWADQYHKKASAGWQGRFRMNGRQKLEKRIAEEGHVLWVMNGKPRKIVPDPQWLAVMIEKHGIGQE